MEVLNKNCILFSQHAGVTEWLEHLEFSMELLLDSLSRQLIFNARVWAGIGFRLDSKVIHAWQIVNMQMRPTKYLIALYNVLYILSLGEK